DGLEGQLPRSAPRLDPQVSIPRLTLPLAEPDGAGGQGRAAIIVPQDALAVDGYLDGRAAQLDHQRHPPAPPPRARRGLEALEVLPVTSQQHALPLGVQGDLIAVETVRPGVGVADPDDQARVDELAVGNEHLDPDLAVLEGRQLADDLFASVAGK